MGRAIIFSGAGLSAESGIPTFRDRGGLWEKYDIDEVANFATFDQNRPAVFRFFNEFRSLLRDKQPNHAHRALAHLQQQFGRQRVLFITQNVDDLLERAGCADVMHVHGFLREMQCLRCGRVWEIGYDAWPLHDPCPGCCGHDIKPHVVLFNEAAPRYTDMYALVDSLTRQDCFAALGTSGMVVPVTQMIAGLPGTKILCNLEPAGFMDEAYFDVCYYQPVTRAIDMIVRDIMRVLG